MPNLATLLPMYTPADPYPTANPTTTETTPHHNTSTSVTSIPLELDNHSFANSISMSSLPLGAPVNANNEVRVDDAIPGLDTVEPQDSQRDIHPALRKPAPVFHRVSMASQAIAGLDGAEDANTMSGALPAE